MLLGVYNFVRKHTTLGTTPAVAAGVEWECWDLERVVEMTADFIRRKEDAKFDEAFAEAGIWITPNRKIGKRRSIQNRGRQTDYVNP